MTKQETWTLKIHSPHGLRTFVGGREDLERHGSRIVGRQEWIEHVPVKPMASVNSDDIEDGINDILTALTAL